MTNKKSFSHFSFLLIVVASVFSSCQEEKEQAHISPFKLLKAEQTGLHFKNELRQDNTLNIFNYMYFFNGSGVGLADFNNDGLVDIYLGANQAADAMFINEGSMHFRNISLEAGLTDTQDWTTGISLVDINNDGLMDIYVNQVGGYLGMKGRNKLFICKEIVNGFPVYEDRAKDYGLDFQGFSTQSVFFDYDMDGDLDMYLLNHSIHQNGTFGEREDFADKKHPTAGDKMFRNDGGAFTDISDQAGIYQNALGYGLGVVVGDANGDGWPDIYVANDFHENDYLYINQKDGTFFEEVEERTHHTSRFSMGADMADINNDGLNDIISLDMQPYDPYILKSSLGEDDYGIYDFKLKYGYGYQYARNNLQLNNGDGTFSEIGLYAGVHATDWSWSSLFFDFDNDGWNDLFVSNGIPRRMNDIDYANFRANNGDHKWKTQANRMDSSDLHLIEMIPQIKINNQFFKNEGDLNFANISKAIHSNVESYSNGAAYADLDNDGDLDIVVNNIDDNPFVYENVNELDSTHRRDFTRLKLEGPKNNINAIGSKLILYTDKHIISKEFYPTRGYQSSMLDALHIGVGDSREVDSVVLIWPDLTYQNLEELKYNTGQTIQWKQGLPKWNESKLRKPTMIEDITNHVGLSLVHKENDFIEFNREKLIPFMVSAEGPAVAVGDVNNDGLDDVFFGSSKRKQSMLLIQNEMAEFVDLTPQIIKDDYVFEDVSAEFVDVDNDDDMDLVVASGGNEYWGESEYLKQRVYLNDGTGNFVGRKDFEGVFTTASKVLTGDFNQDGWVDFFIAGRAKPYNYGVIPRSYVFLNDKGAFKNVTDKYIETPYLGLITDASLCDMDRDGDLDVVLAIEWDVIKLLVNEGDHFETKNIPGCKGWWRFVMPSDFDKDGDIDILAGNVGLNNRLKPSEDYPVEMYVNDFDDNDQIEQLVTYYLKERKIPFASHHELTSQLPNLKRNYLYAKDFAAAPIEDLVTPGKIKSSSHLMVNTSAHVYFENVGNYNFVKHELPQNTQFSTLNTALVLEEHETGVKLLLGGNFYGSNIELGRYDASFGSILEIGKNGDLRSEPLLDAKLHGQVRNIQPIQVGQGEFLLVTKNNGRAQVLQYNK